MKKTMYEKPELQICLFVVEDVIRTSSNVVVGDGDAIFKGYSSEDWT